MLDFVRENTSFNPTDHSELTQLMGLIQTGDQNAPSAFYDATVGRAYARASYNRKMLPTPTR
jgi:hypothetical protein